MAKRNRNDPKPSYTCPPNFNKVTWLKKQLRYLSITYPPALEARDRTRVEVFHPSKAGIPQKRVFRSCEDCGKQGLKDGQYEMDHHIPVSIPGARYDSDNIDWNIYIDRLLCETSNYRTLCIACHDKKSLAQGEKPKKRRKKASKKKVKQ